MINGMKSADSPYLMDVLAISLRWLALFGIAISLGVGGAFIPNEPGSPRLIILVVAMTAPALWNGYVSALAIFNRRLPKHRYINVGLDLLFALILFVVTGGFSGQVFWVAVLPIFSSAVYFEGRGALIIALSISLLQVGYTYLINNNIQALPILLISGLNIIGAAVVALLGAPVIRQLRKQYQATLNQRKESEHTVQRQERDRMKAMFEMIETFSATLNYQTVLETALETAISAMEEPGGVNEMIGAVMLFGDQNDLEVSAARGFAARDLSITLPGDEGAIAEALKNGEICRLTSPSTDPEISQFASMQNQNVGVCLPLIRGMNAYGVMIFGHTAADFFSAERIETLQMLGNQAVISLQNARLYQDLAREKERIIQSQEDAQKNLARSLHDGPTQSVAAIAMRMSIARKLLEQSPAKAMEEMVKIEDLARRTTQEIRHMLFTLRPLVLETEGLVPALQMMADKMHDLYGQVVTIQATPEVVDKLEPNHQSVIFYLAEESVNNARKHARAAEIFVRLLSVPKVEDIAVLEISDNGVGFDVASVMNTYDRRGSLGMINLRERAEQINGLLRIDSAPGKGTRIRVFIPLSEAASDKLHQRR